MPTSTSPLQPQGLRDLNTYRLAKELAHLVYVAAGELPNGEYRTVAQTRGAAISVFGNIAEGYGRGGLGDYIRFCEIARGSLCELGSYIEFRQERNMLQPTHMTSLHSLYNHAWNTLGAIIRSLKEKKVDGDWDRSLKSVREDEQPYDV